MNRVIPHRIGKTASSPRAAGCGLPFAPVRGKLRARGAWGGRRLVVVLGLVLLCSTAAAQSPSEDDGSGLRNRFLPPPRALTTLVLGARKAMEQGRFDDAVQALGVVLCGEPAAEERFTDQDFFVLDADGQLMSLRSYAMELLAKAPPNVLQLYELRYGRQAQRQLEQAQNLRDAGLLGDIARRYVHTRAGYQAGLLQAQLFLDQGEPLAATTALQRLAGWPEARRVLDPELSLWLATAQLLANRPDQATETLWAARAGLGQLSLSPPPPPLPNQQAALRWLNQWIDATRAAEVPRRQWTLYRGDAARNAESPGGMPLLRPRWRLRLHDTPPAAALADALYQGFQHEKLAALPALQPLATRNLILCRTPTQLIAVDLSTGKRVWRYPPWREDELTEKLLDLAPARDPSQARHLETAGLSAALWSDASLGQISCDRDTVYVLQVEQPAPREFPIVGRSREGAPSVCLAALDLRTQGRLRWIVGGGQLNVPELTGAHFLGPPLPAGDQLFAMYEFDGELRVAALDPASGRVLWRQQLAHMEDNVITRDAFRRLAGASPSLEGGLLICPTSAGVVVAIDIQQRSLRWGYRYASYRDQRAAASSSKYANPSPRQPYWNDAAVTVAEQHVLLTPPESEQLHCLDLLTGKLRWVRPRRSGLYVAAVAQGRVIVVGNDTLEAFELADGAPAWSAPLSLDAPPAGRGFRREGCYFLPLANRELWKVDLESGELLQRQASATPWGNLIGYNNQLISVDHQSLQAFYLREPLTQRLEAALSASPEDRWARRQRAELLLEEQRLEEACRELQRLVQSDVSDAASRALYVDACLRWMEHDFDRGAPAAREAFDFFLRGDELRYWKLSLEGLMQRRRWADAVGAAGRIATLMRRGRPDEMLQLADQREIDPQRWLAVQVRRLWASVLADSAAADSPAAEQQASAEQRAAAQRLLEQWFQREWANARRVDSIDRWRWLIEVFDAAPGCGEARLQLAQRQQERGNLLEAEMLTLGLERSSDAALATAAIGRLASLWLEGNRPSPLEWAVRLLDGPHRDTADINGITGRQRLESLEQQVGQRRQAELLTAEAGESAWPNGRVDVQQVSEEGLSYSKRSYPLVSRRFGSLATVFRRAYSLVLERPSSVVMRDRFGRPVLTFSLTGSVRSDAYLMWRMQWSGHFVAAAALSPSTACDLIAINAFTQPDDADAVVLWRQSLTNALPGQASLRRTTQVIDTPLGLRRHTPADAEDRVLASLGPQSRRGVVFRRGVELVCCHPLTGSTLWVRSDVDPGGELVGNDEVVFVCGKQGGPARAFRFEDGAELPSRNVPATDSHLATRGTLVASFTADEQQIEVVAQDLREEQPRWTRRFSPAVKACLVEDDALLLADADGTTVLLSLALGRPLWSTALAPLPEIKDVLAIQSSDRLVILRNSEREAVAPEREFSRAPSVAHAEMFVGDVWCLDHQGGLCWQSPVALEQFAAPADQAPDLPALLLMRNERQGKVATSKVVLLNKRDGSLAAEILSAGKSISSYRAQSDPAGNQMRLEMSTGEFLVTWTSEDRPPRPPATLLLGRESTPPELGEVAAKVLQSAAEQLALPKERSPFDANR